MNKEGLVLALKELKKNADYQTALKVKELYADWEPGKEAKTGDRRLYGDKLYKCRQGHTTQEGWEPDIAPALWEVINEEHAGTLEDPIPYDQAMAVFSGKIYRHNNKLYECIRDSGNPLYADPDSLLGNYFNKID